ncbi:uncharacterized protein LOC141908470 isoform X2 [Tubulanus polymorphus]|uniref:uncharacterized protein LOC141908470 isoform X2 n=1 Tax=Tubulanus polymorphus TaxID=672921 RepID=UPI003DA68245
MSGDDKTGTGTAPHEGSSRAVPCTAPHEGSSRNVQDLVKKFSSETDIYEDDKLTTSTFKQQQIKYSTTTIETSSTSTTFIGTATRLGSPQQSIRRPYKQHSIGSIRRKFENSAAAWDPARDAARSPRADLPSTSTVVKNQTTTETRSTEISSVAEVAESSQVRTVLVEVADSLSQVPTETTERKQVQVPADNSSNRKSIDLIPNKSFLHFSKPRLTPKPNIEKQKVNQNSDACEYSLERIVWESPECRKGESPKQIVGESPEEDELYTDATSYLITDDIYSDATSLTIPGLSSLGDENLEISYADNVKSEEEGSCSREEEEKSSSKEKEEDYYEIVKLREQNKTQLIKSEDKNEEENEEDIYDDVIIGELIPAEESTETGENNEVRRKSFTGGLRKKKFGSNRRKMLSTQSEPTQSDEESLSSDDGEYEPVDVVPMTIAQLADVTPDEQIYSDVIYSDSVTQLNNNRSSSTATIIDKLTAKHQFDSSEKKSKTSWFMSRFMRGDINSSSSRSTGINSSSSRSTDINSSSSRSTDINSSSSRSTDKNSLSSETEILSKTRSSSVPNISPSVSPRLDHHTAPDQSPSSPPDQPPSLPPDQPPSPPDQPPCSPPDHSPSSPPDQSSDQPPCLPPRGALTAENSPKLPPRKSSPDASPLDISPITTPCAGTSPSGTLRSGGTSPIPPLRRPRTSDITSNTLVPPSGGLNSEKRISSTSSSSSTGTGTGNIDMLYLSPPVPPKTSKTRPSLNSVPLAPSIVDERLYYVPPDGGVSVFVDKHGYIDMDQQKPDNDEYLDMCGAGRQADEYLDMSGAGRQAEEYLDMSGAGRQADEYLDMSGAGRQAEEYLDMSGAGRQAEEYLDMSGAGRQADEYLDMSGAGRQAEEYLDMSGAGRQADEYLDMSGAGRQADEYLDMSGAGRQADEYLDMDQQSKLNNNKPINLHGDDGYIDMDETVRNKHNSGSSEDYIHPECINNKQPLSPTATTQRPFTGIWSMPKTTAPAAAAVHDQQYLEIINDVKRIKRTSRYQSKFGERAPLYQMYHEDYSTRKTLTRRPINLKPSGLISDNSIYTDPTILVTPGLPVTPGLDDYDDVSSSDSDDYQLTPDLNKSTSSADRFSKCTGSGLRTLWAEMPEVKSSGVLTSVDSVKRKLQESMFEVITSEASYLKSLHIFLNVFMCSNEFSNERSYSCIINQRDRHVLYSNIIAVMETSERMLSDLETRWIKENPVLSDVCDIICEHASKHFDVYIKYCTNQIYQLRILDKLMDESKVFAETVRRLQAHPDCQFLPLRSFLTLPMQRITRLPLLIDAILKRTTEGTSLFESASKAFQIVQNIVLQCNEGARSMERMEQMLEIDKQLNFSKQKMIPLISSSRYLIKKGEVTRILTEQRSKFGSLLKKSTRTIHLFLFNDLLVIATKKSEESYLVFDYCSRISLHTELIDDPVNDPRLPSHLPSNCTENLFILVLLENHDNKTVEFIVSVPSPSDRARWIEVLSPAEEENEDEKIYETWDCPQVQAVYSYEAQQPDEIGLEPSDVIKVHKKMADGWFEGERIRDGQRGWFPSNYVTEVSNPRQRRRNLVQKHRLLNLAMSHLNTKYS